jgi:hypothetical protein
MIQPFFRRIRLSGPTPLIAEVLKQHAISSSTLLFFRVAPNGTTPHLPSWNQIVSFYVI